jgi:hypothetical protein
MSTPRNTFPRFILGKSQAHGFTSFSDGDIFEKSGKLYQLCGGDHGWTLRPILASNGKVDFTSNPLAGWIDIPSAETLIQKINQEAEA